MSVWSPTPPLNFFTGAYPNQFINRSDISLLVDNAKLTYKETIAYYTTTPPTAVTNATSGAWSSLGAFVINANGGTLPNAIVAKIPLLIQFNAQVLASAAVANKIMFAWFDNNVQVGGVAAKYTASDLLQHGITLEKYIIPSGSVNGIDLRWQVEAAGVAVTFSMPQGFRLIATPI